MPESAPGRVRGLAALRNSLSGGLRSFLEIFALCGFAMAQPVLDVMGRSPDYFIFRQADRHQIIFLAVALVLVPPVSLWMAETTVGMLGDTARRVASVLIRGGLVGLIGLQVLQTLTGLNGPGLLVAGGVVGVAGMVALLRYRTVSLWLRYLIPAPIVFATLFLAFSPVSDLVWRSGPAMATATAVNSSETPAVVLLLDELPLSSLLNGRGEIDARLYPNFARLARESTWFRNTTAVAAYTPVAVPAMLSGRLPKEAVAPTSALFPDTLFTLLAGSHDLVAYETLTALCPQRVCQTADVGPGGRRELFEDATRVWEQIMSPSKTRRDVTSSLREETVKQRQKRYGGAGATLRPRSVDDVWFRRGWFNENQPARFADFVAGLDDYRRPRLWFLHLLLPHSPFRYLPSGLQYDGSMLGEHEARLTGQAWPSLHIQQRHVLQTIYADALLGQVLDRLQATGLYDRSVLVLASDHGQDFAPGSHGRGVNDNLADLAWVPFFVKAPGQHTAQVSDANVQTIDLLPTVADLLGIPVPWEIDGMSAVGPTRRADGGRPFFDGGTTITLQTDEWFSKVLRGWPESVARADLGPEGLFAVGPFADLVGSSVLSHQLSESRGAHATVDGLDAYANVHPASGVVPALVAGQIDHAGEIQPPYSVAVAINGTIGGVSEVFQQGEIRRKFAAMVSDSLLVPGENQLELYLVTRGRSVPTLFPVRLTG